MPVDTDRHRPSHNEPATFPWGNVETEIVEAASIRPGDWLRTSGCTKTGFWEVATVAPDDQDTLLILDEDSNGNGHVQPHDTYERFVGLKPGVANLGSKEREISARTAGAEARLAAATLLLSVHHLGVHRDCTLCDVLRLLSSDDQITMDAARAMITKRSSP